MSSSADTDAALLKTFASSGSQDAFRALAERYAGLVFSVALRRTSQHPLAEEIAQNVFAVLARKAGALASPGVSLAAWLHRATVLESACALRRESGRRRRMEEYTRHLEIMNAESSPEPPAALADMDSSLDSLPRRDRELLLARFFENRSYQEISQTTGRNEAALMQQQRRALEKLAAILKRRGAGVSAVSLTASLSAGFSQSAPAGLAASLAVSAPAAISAVSGGMLLLHSLEILMHTKLKLTILSALGLCLLAGAGAFHNGKSRAEATLQPRLAAALAAAEATPSPSVRNSQAAAAADRTAPAPADIQEKLEAAAAAWRAADEFPDRMKALEVLDALTAEETITARDFLETVKEEYGLHLALAKRIAILWSIHEPEAALDWGMAYLSRENRIDPLKTILDTWSHREPQKALAWWRQVSDSLEFPIAEDAFERMSDVIHAGWAATDPRGLAQTLPEITDPNGMLEDGDLLTGTKLMSLATATVDPGTRQATFDAVSAIPHDLTKAVAASGIISVMLSTGSNMEQVRDFALSLKIADPTAKAIALSSAALTGTLLDLSTATEGVAWLRQHTDDETARRAVEDFIRRTEIGDSGSAALRQALENK